jgi:transcription termination/antitermination protein NusG
MIPEPEFANASARLPALGTQSRPGLPSESRELKWYAAYTCARHEKRATELLERKSVETLLPLYETVHRWKNGLARVRLPLFPGYVFVRIALANRLQVLEVPSIVRLVGFCGQPAPLPEEDIETIQSCLKQGPSFEPHPYLKVGRRVRITTGPLAGCEGLLVRKKGNLRVVLSIELIQRSVMLDVPASSLELAG